jgi:Gpi18-like mannosyltransferase
LRNTRQKLLGYEQKFLSFVQTREQLLLGLLFTVLALLIRFALFDFKSDDLNLYYHEWLRHLHENGGFAAIPTLKSDYTVAYQYLLALVSYLPWADVLRIKLISLPFDFGNAILVMLLVRKAGNYSRTNLIPLIAYGFTLFLPTAFINSALWGQCDAIYTFFSLLMLYLFLEGKFSGAWISFGLAISFKLQAIFLLPLLGFLYLKTRKFSVSNFLWIPLVYTLMYLPALALGKPLSEFFGAYADQVYQFRAMRLLFPNLWQLLPNDYEYYKKPALYLTAFALSLFFALFWQKKDLKINASSLVPLAMFTVMIATFFLPAMHERYMYTAEILAVAYLFMNPRRWPIALGAWIIGFSGYTIVLWQYGPLIPFELIALLYSAILILGIVDLYQKPNLESAEVLPEEA